jgi:hypothetical protein
VLEEIFFSVAFGCFCFLTLLFYVCAVPVTPDFVYLVSDCPHDWLFPQCAAVIHHGGAGTTAAGLKAAVLFFPSPSRKLFSFIYQIIFLAMLAAESDCPQADASTLKLLFDI